MSLYDWSVIAITNEAADANINWTEGQAASTVNDSARGMMAAVRAFLQQINGSATSAGSLNNYTLTSPDGNALTVYAAGNIVCFKANLDNTASATLDVDGLGPKLLKKFGSTDLVANDIETGNLVLAIYDGTHFQILSPVANNNIEAFSALTGAADKLSYFNGASSMTLTDFTATARDLLAGANAAAMQSTLGLVPGTNVQAQDVEVQAFANLASGVNLLPYFNGAGTMATTGFTSAGRALVDDANNTAQRGTLGIPENTRNITFGTTLPGPLAVGEIYLRHL